MKVTIHDVARHAGVSAMTVSRVVNERPRVSVDTRKRVQASIAELGYVPNRLARGLIQRKTGAFGVIVPDVANPFFTLDRKSTRLNSSHSQISYAVFCLKK